MQQGSVQFLPSISGRSMPMAAKSNQSSHSNFTLPQLADSATKAERYNSLTRFDRNGIQRAKGHVRNALKTTGDLDKISKQLDQVGNYFDIGL